jgi:hypothetical protein
MTATLPTPTPGRNPEEIAMKKYQVWPIGPAVDIEFGRYPFSG